MHLLSTGDSSILTSFKNLETKYVYAHADGGITDFQFCAQTPIFVEVNKKTGIEILRIKDVQSQRKEIQRVRKVNMENVYCVAGGKQSVDEIGVGLSSGQVSLFNYATSECVHKYNAEGIRKCVLHLDFNASDEYISSVLESGEIIIYGTKTRAKIDTLNIDGNSTLTRFHPSKRFHLCVASYKGAVTIYDIHAKKKIFHNIDSHAAPCRDLCMSAASPDTLVSVGFDCLINIFDTRRKMQPLQLHHCHPLSTVALSECGTFICVGNLKGELISHDVRNTKLPLAVKKVHECGITRIAFVPYDGDARTSFATPGNTAFTTDVTETDKTELQCHGDDGDFINMQASDGLVRGKCDSFSDFLDIQVSRASEKINSRSVGCRDSYDCWDALKRKPRSDGPVANSCNNSSSTGLCDSIDCKKSTNGCGGSSMLPLRERSNNLTHMINSKLVQIQEELSLQNTTTESDKENPVMELPLMSRLQILPADRKSTPNRIDQHSDQGSEVKDAEEVSVPATAVHTDFKKLLIDIDMRFEKLESELKFQLEMNKWQIFTQNFNLWSKQNTNTEAVWDALSILLQTDPFVNEFIRLKKENEELKLQLKERKSKK